MLKIAKARVPKAKFKETDFYHFNFPDNYFDGFWASASFLHVPKKHIGRVLQEARRITQKGGVGFIALKKKTTLDEGVISQNKQGVKIKRLFAFYFILLTSLPSC